MLEVLSLTKAYSKDMHALHPCNEHITIKLCLSACQISKSAADFDEITLLRFTLKVVMQFKLDLYQSNINPTSCVAQIELYTYFIKYGSFYKLF
jgi:hypothetical protein